MFGSVRSRSDADRLAGEFGERFTPLFFDMTDQPAVRGGAAVVETALGGKPLFGLVNNAGIAVPGPLLHLDIESFRRQLDVNVTGQLIVIPAFAQLLGPRNTRTPGRIVMISSVDGRNASPFIGAYNAWKFALEGMLESLRRELMLWEVDVIVVAPSAIGAPIWDKVERLDMALYANTRYAASLKAVRDFMIVTGRKGLKPEQVGRVMWQALTSAKPKTRYVVTPDPSQNLLVNHLPKRMVDRVIARRLSLLSK